MSEYERTLTVEAPADTVFQYVSDQANLATYLPESAPEDFSSIDRESRMVEWVADGHEGSIEVDPGDVATSVSELTFSLSYDDRPVSDTPTELDEQALATIDKALHIIREHVEKAHRAHRANFL